MVMMVVVSRRGAVSVRGGNCSHDGGGNAGRDRRLRRIRVRAFALATLSRMFRAGGISKGQT